MRHNFHIAIFVSLALQGKTGLAAVRQSRLQKKTGNDVTIITPSEDTDIWDLYPNESFGTGINLYVQYFPHQTKSLIKFNFEGVVEDHVKKSRKLSSAVLKLCVNKLSSVDTTMRANATIYRTIQVVRTPTSWDEDTANWENQPVPVLRGNKFTVIYPRDANKWKEVDVTDLFLNEWAADEGGKGISFLLEMTSRSTDDDECTFFSREYSNASLHPRLELTFRSTKVTENGILGKFTIRVVLTVTASVAFMILIIYFIIVTIKKGISLDIPPMEDECSMSDVSSLGEVTVISVKENNEHKEIEIV